jgi:hypothetical protein
MRWWVDEKHSLVALLDILEVVQQDLLELVWYRFVRYLSYTLAQLLRKRVAEEI